LKDKAFLTFLGQNPPFELRRKLAFASKSFHEIHLGSSKYRSNPSISVGGGQQGWLAFVAPKAKLTRSNRVARASFFLFYNAICALGLKIQLCLARVSKQKSEDQRHSDMSVVFGLEICG
jgi:hypothetical protein